MIDTCLKDKIVLITGANYGIDAVAAVAFAKEKDKVFINYLRLSPEEYGGVTQFDSNYFLEINPGYSIKFEESDKKEWTLIYKFFRLF